MITGPTGPSGARGAQGAPFKLDIIQTSQNASPADLDLTGTAGTTTSEVDLTCPAGSVAVGSSHFVYKGVDDTAIFQGESVTYLGARPVADETVRVRFVVDGNTQQQGARVFVVCVSPLVNPVPPPTTTTTSTTTTTTPKPPDACTDGLAGNPGSWEAQPCTAPKTANEANDWAVLPEPDDVRWVRESQYIELDAARAYFDGQKWDSYVP